MSLFKRKPKVINAVMNELVDEDNTVHQLPPDTPHAPASIGDDVNLLLIVKELGARQKKKIAARRNELLAELQKVDKELLQLDVLLDAANSL